jgi:hypothetical protein
VFTCREDVNAYSFKQCQREFQNKCGEGSVPTKACIHKLVEKLETTGNVLTRHAGAQKRRDRAVKDVSTCQFL